MWKFLRVDIADINPSVPKETFSETELNNLANLIIEMGGLIRPAILKKADNKKVGERYDIISGNLEYYASVIANQKAPDIEMINAFVVDKEAESISSKIVDIESQYHEYLQDKLSRKEYSKIITLEAFKDEFASMPMKFILP